MANWGDIMNNCLTMGRGRWLCYAINVERRRIENGTWEENFNRYCVRGRSRPILTPRSLLQIHHRLVPPGQPWGAVAGFGHMYPNISWSPRVNNLQPCLPSPQHYIPPPPSHDQEGSAEESPSESSESGEGDSLEANHGLS